MNRGGAGLGSGLIILVFSTLCLTFFAVISFSSARTDKTMSGIKAQTVKSYYEADTLAEYILAEILEAEVVPDNIRGTGITRNTETGAISFYCPVSDRKELYVEVIVSEDSYNILEWHLRDAGVWETDKSLPVWPGD